MGLSDTINIIDFLKGPDLLLNNIFRLAQLPVDIQEKELKKRHKAVEMANKMNMPPPPGIMPIFAVKKEDEEQLKEVLHTLQDPLNRLFNELFWFWPQTFGQSREDEGLVLLADNKLKAAVKYWKKKESDPESFIPTHNLAILHQFLALETEVQLIEAKEPVKKKGILGFKRSNPDAGKAKKHWDEAYQKWQVLMDSDLFWAYLKDRIKNYNDPRLRVETADLLKQHMAGIILSMNIHLVFRTAKSNLLDQTARQWEIINSSGIEQKKISQTIDAFTEEYRSQINHFCKSAKEDVKKDPVKAEQPIRLLAKQTTSVLDLLSHIYQTGNDTLISLHDQVAVAIAQCDDIFDAKTQNWQTSLELLTIAKSIARGQAARERVDKDIKQVQDLKKNGNDWCQDGYFNLPGPCIELLENARVYMKAEQYDESISLLKKAYTGETPVPGYDTLLPYLKHCLSFNFKCKGIMVYNDAYDVFNSKVSWALKDSISGGQNRMSILNRLNSSMYLNQQSSVYCKSCFSAIYGQYVIRTIEGTEYPFCKNCNIKLKNKIEGFESILKKAVKQSIDLMILAQEFDPEFEVVTRNIKIIRETAVEKGISLANPMDLKLEWDLFNTREMLNFLTNSVEFKSAAQTKIVWNKFVRMLNSWGIDQRDRLLNRVFQSIAGNEDNCNILIDHFLKDDYIFSQFVKFCISDEKIASGNGDSVIVKVLTKKAGTAVQFAFINKVKIFCENPIPVVKILILSIEAHVIKAVKQIQDGNPSLGSGELKVILDEAKAYDPVLEYRLLIAVIKACSVNSSKAGSLVRQSAWEVNKKFNKQFYHILESDHLTTKEKMPYYEILVWHHDEKLRLKALEWIALHAEKPNRTSFLIRALDDPDEQINRVSQERLLQLNHEAFGPLLEASCTRREKQFKIICSLLGRLKSKISWQEIQAPVEELLIRICIESKEEPISLLALETLEKCHPGWVKHTNINSWIAWLKYSAAHDENPAASVSDKLLSKIRQQSLWMKFKAWNTRGTQLPLNENKPWWEFKKNTEASQSKQKKQPPELKRQKTVETSAPVAPPRATVRKSPCMDCGNVDYHFYDDTKEYLCSLCGWVYPEKADARPGSENVPPLKKKAASSVEKAPPLEQEAVSTVEKARSSSIPVEEDLSLESRVVQIISDHLGLSADTLDRDADLTGGGYGMDSLDMVEITMTLEEEFNLSISDEDASRARSVKDICHYLAQYA